MASCRAKAIMQEADKSVTQILHPQAPPVRLQPLQA
jgi:hypothetical protein